MAFNKNNAKNAIASGGIPFLPEDLTGTLKFKESLVPGKTYRLGRLGVVKGTKRFDQPFAALELDGQFYTGYATAISNQITQLIDGEIASGNTQGMVSNSRVAYSEGAAELNVQIEVLRSDFGEYFAMKIVD